MRYLSPERAEIESQFNKGKPVQTRQQIYDDAMTLFENALNRRLESLHGKETLRISFQIYVIDRDGKVKSTSRRETGTKEYRAWRKAVLKRDNYICQECGATDSVIAHHIKHWAHYPELRYVVSNGQTLCEACHLKKHPHLRLKIRPK